MKTNVIGSSKFAHKTIRVEMMTLQISVMTSICVLGLFLMLASWN